MLNKLPHLPGAMRATYYLALARLRLSRIKPHDVMELNGAGVRQSDSVSLITPGSVAGKDASDSAPNRVAFYINRMSHRVPWRSDCLVQALAGQAWLQKLRIHSEIQIGAKRLENGDFYAHAWLSSGNKVLLGGNIEDYTTLIE